MEHWTLLLLASLFLAAGLWASLKLLFLSFEFLELVLGPIEAGPPDMVFDTLFPLSSLDDFEEKTEAMKSYPEYDSALAELIGMRLKVSKGQRDLRARGYTSVDEAPPGWEPPRKVRW